MKKKSKKGTDVYAAYANPKATQRGECGPFVSCPCDTETNPCAYCNCAPRSCACRTYDNQPCDLYACPIQLSAAYSGEEHDPVKLAILRAMEEGKTIDELLERIKKQASVFWGRK